MGVTFLFFGGLELRVEFIKSREGLKGVSQFSINLCLMSSLVSFQAHYTSKGEASENGMELMERLGFLAMSAGLFGHRV